MRLQKRLVRQWETCNFMVGRHVDQQNGKNVWWFTVKVPEKKLLELDKKWNHKHWRWQRVQGGGNDF